MEQELLTYEFITSFSGVRVAQSKVLCSVYCHQACQRGITLGENKVYAESFTWDTKVLNRLKSNFAGTFLKRPLQNICSLTYDPI